jgi:hypothetical protein
MFIVTYRIGGSGTSITTKCNTQKEFDELRCFIAERNGSYELNIKKE